MNDFERELRDSLSENARHAPPGDGLAERIIAEARRGAPERHSRGSRWRAWSLPAIAAACVAGVVASIAVAGALQHRTAHSAHTPSLRLTPTSTSAAPLSSVTPTTAAASSIATSTAPPTTAAPAPGAVPKGFQASDLTFVGTQQGWALGTGKCVKDPSQGCNAVLHTSDGGQHWAAVASPPPGTEHIRFANDHTGYAYGPNALFMTTDGGGDWISQSGGADALETLSGNVIRVTDTGGCPPGCGYRVLTAPIGSDQWHTAHLPHSVNGDHVLLSRTGDAAYLLIQQNPAGGAGSELPTLLTSSDDGRSWTDRGTPCPQESGRYGELDAALMTTAESGSVVLVCTPRAGSSSGQFTATSADGGKSFQVGGQHAFGNLAQTLGAATESVLLVSAGDTYRSTDGGQTWHQLGASGPGKVSWIGFENATVGRAISADGRTIWTTTDAGATWTGYTFQ